MSENKNENNNLTSWIDKRLPVFTFINHNQRLSNSKKLKLFLEFRVFTTGITLVIMIVTGILLAMQYTANTDIAFDSVERIIETSTTVGF